MLHYKLSWLKFFLRIEYYSTMKLAILSNPIRRFCSDAIVPKICIVGAGPAGFYAAQQLLKSSSNVRIDILEKLPVPFGLVRFGVAPDHPEVKNVINTFHKTATNPRVQFIGNVSVGKDVSVEQLQEIYHAILLTYGAEEDRLLNVPGESLKNVISGREFVGWYNGLPSCKNLEINLDTEEAVIFGQGNVAVDIARILLTPIDKLKTTDITSHALERLSRSRIRKILMIGRRGPLQAAFTIAELREMLKLDNCNTCWRPEDFTNVREVVSTLVRPRKRLTELMIKSLEEQSINVANTRKEFHPIFLRSPVEFFGSCSVNKVKVSINQLEGNDFNTQNAKSTGTFEEISTDLVFRSIGYKSVPIDPSVPFDQRAGKVKNTSGKINDNIYAAGWVATGPVGVILSTMTSAFQVGKLISKNLVVTGAKLGLDGLHEILDAKGIQTVSYDDWEKIDRVERDRGKEHGKPREKIVDIDEMLKIASR